MVDMAARAKKGGRANTTTPGPEDGNNNALLKEGPWLFSAKAAPSH